MEAMEGIYRLAFPAMGTQCRVDFAAASSTAARGFRGQMFRWLSEFEGRFSRFIPDSLVSRVNQAAGLMPVAVDDEAESLFRLCDWFHWCTFGIFDPTALPLILLWDYQSPGPVVPDDAAIHAALGLVGWKKVQRGPGSVFLPQAGMGIDLGGIGKEYAVDRVLEMALDSGIRDIIVDFGHDVRAHGEPPEGGPWRIGLEDPGDPGQCWGGVAVRDRAVCTSGDYARNFVAGGRRYGHILDPRTGCPVANGCRSVSVVAQTCTEAGMLATTAFVMGAQAGIDFLSGFYGTEGCVWADNGCTETRGFQNYVIKRKKSAGLAGRAGADGGDGPRGGRIS